MLNAEWMTPIPCLSNSAFRIQHSALLMRLRPFSIWVLVVGGGLAARDAERLPLAAAERLRDVDHLADVIRRVREGAVQRLVHFQALAADRDIAVQHVVGQIV